MEIYTSYYAKVPNLPPDLRPISISRKSPHWIPDLASYKTLAPSEDILYQHKKNPDENRYTQRFFHEILYPLNLDQVMEKLLTLGSGYRGIVLLCYEKPEDFCHRHLVARYLNTMQDRTYINYAFGNAHQFPITEYGVGAH